MLSSEIRVHGVYLARKSGKTFKVAVEGLHPAGGWIVTKVDPRTGVATGRTLRFKSPRPFVQFLKMGWERNPAKGRPLESFSVAAHDMFQIATSLAGFDKATLLKEIIRLQRGFDRKISERTVLNAMQIISDRWKDTGSQG